MSGLGDDGRFTLRDVFVDTLTSMRKDWLAHAGWNLIWIALAMTSCCGLTMVLGVVGTGVAVSGDGTSASRYEGAQFINVGLYLVLPPLMLGLYALHQSVTMSIVRARTRGTPITLRDGIRQGLARTPALVSHLLLRTILEGVPLAILYAIVIVIVFGVRGIDPTALRHLRPVPLAPLGVAYVVVLGLAFGVRGFIGLALPCVVAGSGPWAAFGESVRLLRGRRLQLIRTRAAMWAVWMVGFAVCMGPFYAWTLTSARHSHPSGTLALALAGVLALHGVTLFSIVIDAALEASFYVRATRPLDATALAATFD